MNIHPNESSQLLTQAKPKTCSVAIVGVGMRLPGQITDLETLQRFLMDRGDAISDLPAGRWAADLFDPSQSIPGTTYVRRGGYVEDLDLIDLEFFGLSTHEASRIDPQQRLLLETSFEALEMAGIGLEKVSGRPVGVFVGLSSADYMHLQTRDPRSANAYTNVGSATSIASNRISYEFNLRGPSLTVDTACSSGLTAIHLGVNAIETGECECAIVGAANALFEPEFFINFCAASMLSPVGQCRAFDKDGAGFVRAEGAVAFVLKPLERALADNDPILSVIRASNVNNDGRTNGIALPSGDVQAELLRGIYGEGLIDADELGYVEAHGTGTQAGDPQEAQALGTVIGQTRAGPLPIGSIKTNLGHLEPVSGLVGMLKAIVSLRSGIVPPQIHFDSPNPSIDFEDLGLQVVDTPLDLPSTPTVKVGVNSFGFGGANAHVVLERAPVLQAVEIPAAERHLILVSGHSPNALRDNAAAIARRVHDEPDLSLQSLSATLLTRRTWHSDRAVFFAGSRAHLLRSLELIVKDDPSEDISIGRALPVSAPAFVFTGNGPQWFAMGHQLLQTNRVYRETVEEISELFLEAHGLDLLAEMQRDEASSRMGSTDVAQPSLFALQLGLVNMLAAEGIRPGAVVGHSAGELAAAHVAGIHDLPTIVRLVAARSSQQERTAGEGAMAAIGIGVAEAEALIDDMDGVVVAGENAAKAVTIAGPASQIESLVARLDADGIFARKLRLNYAFHSPIMDRIENGFRDMIGDVAATKPAVPFYSTVGGALSDGGLGADYWWDNLRKPVQFRNAIDAMLDDGHKVFLEVGPHPNLTGYVTGLAKGASANVRIAETLRRDGDETQLFERSVTSLIAAGAEVDLSVRFPDPVRPISMPAYPWQRERHFHSPPSEMGKVPSGHSLLGSRLPVGSDVFSNKLALVSAPFLRDHQVRETVLYPATGFFELAVAAARTIDGESDIELQHVMIKKALPIEDGQIVDLQTTVDRDAQRFNIKSRIETVDGFEELPYVDHVDGMVMFRPHAARNVDLSALGARMDREVSIDEHYTDAADRGLNYGENFRTVKDLRLGDGELLARIQRTGDSTADHYLDPTMLDGALQALIVFGRSQLSDGLFLPVRLERLQARGTTRDISEVVVHVVMRGGNRAYLSCDLTICSIDGEVIAELFGMQVRRVAGAEAANSLLYAHVLEPVYSFGAALPSVPLGELVSDELRAAYEPRAAAADRLLDLCDVARSAYVANAFEALAGTSAFSVAELVANGTLAPQHEKYAHAMLADASLSQHVSRSNDRYRVESTGDPWTIWREAYAEFPNYMPDMLLMALVGQNLAKVLAGELTAQEVLFPRTGSSFMEQLYESGFSSGPHNKVLQGSISNLVDRLPKERHLRILEIGAGTGGTTSHLLAALPKDRCEYVFSDISSAFFPAAEKRFGSFPWFRTHTVDITKDPDIEALGGAFDVVVAANSLHATPDLMSTLSNARGYLAPGGLLFLLEVAPAPHFIFQFGLLTGFWDFQDHEVRQDNCVISSERWPDVLKCAGFDDVALQTEFTSKGQEIASVLVASSPSGTGQQHAGETIATGDAETSPALVIVDRAPDGLRRSIEAAFDKLGRTVSVVASTATGARYPDLGLPLCEPSALIETLDKLEAVPGEIIYLAADGEIGEAVDLDEGWFLVSLLQAIGSVRWDKKPALTIVTAGLSAHATNIPGAAAWAIGRVLSNEDDALRCHRIDVERSSAGFERTAGLIAAGRGRYPQTIPKESDELLVTSSGIFVAKLDHLATSQIEGSVSAKTGVPFAAALRSQGSIDRLGLFVRQDAATIEQDEVEIAIEAASLNFRDVINALGLLPPELLTDSEIGFLTGFEAAGTVVRAGSAAGFAPGDRVMAMAPGALASSVVAKAHGVRAIPQGWTFEDAATLPVVGLTVIYALKTLARLAPGETILVHGGAGGVGLAAISYARSVGARVIATAGASDKRALLQAIGVDVVLDSRSLSFAEDVREHTGGEGVDVVLNSLAGDAMHASLSLLKPFARFIEIGKRDFEANNSLALRMLIRNISYFAVDLAVVETSRPDVFREVWEHLDTYVDNGSLHPLPRRTFPFGRIKEAFRYLQAGKNIGKVTIVNDLSGAILKDPNPPLPKISPDGAHIITGGLGGLGLQVADWLLSHGARNIVLVGRSGITTDAQQEAVDALRDQGAEVVVECADVSDPSETEALVERTKERFGAVRGLVHSVLSLADEFILNLTHSDHVKALAAKVKGAEAFNRLLWDDPLDYFVCFSSAANVMGNPSQANYAAANAILESIVLARRGAGRPALALCLGPVTDVGFVARNAEKVMFEQVGVLEISSKDVLHAMETLIPTRQPVATVVALSGNSPLPISRSARLVDVMNNSEQTPDGGRDARIDLSAIQPGERLATVEGVLVAALAQVSGLKRNRIDVERSFASAGLDSLMAVEMGAIIEQRLGASIPMAELSKDRSIREHAGAICSQLGLETEGQAETTGAGDAALIVPITTDDRVSGAPTIVALHDVTGLVGAYRPLAECIGSGAQVVGVQAKGADGESQPVLEYGPLLDGYTSAIGAKVDEGPLVMLGWSYGGILANDIACQLVAGGRPVDALVVLDAVQDTSRQVGADGFRASEDFRRWGEKSLRVLAHSIAGLSGEENQSIAKDVLGVMREGSELEPIVDAILELSGNADNGQTVFEQHQIALRLTIANFLAMNSRPVMPTFDGKILLLRAPDTRQVVEDPLFGWGAHPENVLTVDVSSDHLNLLQPESAAEISSIIKDFIRAQAFAS